MQMPNIPRRNRCSSKVCKKFGS